MTDLIRTISPVNCPGERCSILLVDETAAETLADDLERALPFLPEGCDRDRTERLYALSRTLRQVARRGGTAS